MWKDFLKNVALNHFATNIYVRLWWKMELPSTIVKWIAAMMAYAMEPKHQWSASSCCWHALSWLGVNIGFWAPNWGAPTHASACPIPGQLLFVWTYAYAILMSFFFRTRIFFPSTFVFGHVKYNRGFILFLVLQMPWPFLVFHDLRFSCHFRKFQNFTWMF